MIRYLMIMGVIGGTALVICLITVAVNAIWATIDEHERRRDARRTTKDRLKTMRDVEARNRRRIRRWEDGHE